MKPNPAWVFDIPDDGARRKHLPLVTLHKNLLDPARVAAAYEGMKSVKVPPNLFWLEKQSLPERAIVQLDEYFTPTVASFIVDYLMKLLTIMPAEDVSRAAGFELWWNVYGVAKDDLCFLHIDSDEELKRRRHIVVAPRWSTVLYVGPATGLVGGETVFNTRALDDTMLASCYNARPFSAWSEMFSDWIEIEPEQNRTVLFEGSTPHLVKPLTAHPDGGPRVTLLVSLWQERPSGFSEERCSRVTPTEFHVLQRVSEQELHALGSLSRKLSLDEIGALHGALVRLFS
jgi:hypothetical protein